MKKSGTVSYLFSKEEYGDLAPYIAQAACIEMQNHEQPLYNILQLEPTQKTDSSLAFLHIDEENPEVFNKAQLVDEHLQQFSQMIKNHQSVLFSYLEQIRHENNLYKYILILRKQLSYPIPS
jgi:hypothetical protein